MLLIALISLYIFLSAVFMRYFKGHALRYIPILYVLLYVIASLFLQASNDGLFYGKPDQYAYLTYGQAYKYETWAHIAGDQGYHNPLYWYLISKIELLTSYPVECMRFLNFTAHLIAIVYCFKTLRILAVNESMAIFGAYVIALSPTLLGLDLYIIRDSLMLSVFIVAFYNIVVLYRSTHPLFQLRYIVATFLLSMIAIGFRAQLGLIILILAMAPFFRAFVSKRALLFIPVFIAVALLFFGVVQLAIENARYAFYALVEIVAPQTSWYYILKFLLYASGFGFLDPTTPKTFGFMGLIVQRVMTIDSLIFMFTFLMMFIFGRIRQDKKLVNVVMMAYFMYSAIYFYFGRSDPELGLHSRALLPFYYLSLVFVLSNIKAKIQGNSQEYLQPSRSQ